MTSAARVAADLLDPQPDPHINDPTGWAQRLGIHLWSAQRQVLDALVTHRKVAVHSAHGVGKSYLAALAIGWWVDTRPPEDTVVVSTAPTYPQVHRIVWKEVRSLHATSTSTDRPLPGRVLASDVWKVDGHEVAFGRKPADHDEHGFQGIHEPHLLAVIDESCGVPESLWTGVEAITTTSGSKILAIGNPDDPTSKFAKVCRPGSGWHVIRIDGLASPNVTADTLRTQAEAYGLTDDQTAALLAELPDGWDGEPVPDRLADSLVQDWWIVDKVREWGIGSPIWVAKVRGTFPDDAEDTVVPLSWAERCREWDGGHPDTHLLPVELGVDVGAGGDETVIVERRGVKAGRMWRSRHKDPDRLLGEVMHAVRETGATAVKVDATGWGYGLAESVVRECNREGIVLTAHPVYVGERAADPVKYQNLKAQIWWEVGREQSQHRQWDLGQMDDDAIAQLTNVKWRPNATGRTQIERKEEVRERAGRSPDVADALLLAYYTPPASGDAVVEHDPGWREDEPTSVAISDY